MPARSPIRAARERVLAAALAGSFLVAAGWSVAPAPVRAADPVPACTVANRLTPIRTFARVRDTFVDTAWTVGPSYAPTDLVPSTRAGLNAGFRVRATSVPDLRAMSRAAAGAGVRLRLVSAFRSYRTQAALLVEYTRRLGRARALLRVARPGHSEHQLGVAIDIGATPGAYAWAARNAWRYGFVLSYPAGRTTLSCYQYEPWHLRWVGRPRARAVHATGLVYRVWLWRNVRDSHS